MLNRRQFLSETLVTAVGCCLGVTGLSGVAEAAATLATGEKSTKRSGTPPEKNHGKKSRRKAQTASATQPAKEPNTSNKVAEQEPDLAEASGRQTRLEDIPENAPEEIRDYLVKMRNYDQPTPDDVILPPAGKQLLDSVMARMSRLQNHIGHGHFYLIGIDEAARYAKRPAIGAFPKVELEFLEKLFYSDAALYGFMDKKPLEAFTASVPPKRVMKVPGMGNYIYKGESEQKWQEICKILGNEVVLTSGVRGIVKQFYLFLAKAQNNGGNLSLASRSLAPPGYSFHAIGDFDVGQRGFGVRNFMVDFTSTPVYKALSERGYITLRYPRDNLLGVRFEPWHVKVIS